MNQEIFNQQLLAFLGASPTPFHATGNIAIALEKSGFQQLEESEPWHLQKPGKYFITRNHSSIIAFTFGQESWVETGFKMVGAHTDSPCLKIKPQADMERLGIYQLGVEVYGGALYNPWFDRDLSAAGRVHYQDKEGKIQHVLFDFGRPIAFIPSLAIHLDRDANEGRTVNPQRHLPPVLKAAKNERDRQSFRDLLKDELNARAIAAEKVLDYEMYLYDTQKPAFVGLKQEFLASARIDNLASCFIALKSLVDSDESVASLIVCNDHEEVGSASACGAKGPFLQNTLERIEPDVERRNRAIANSMLISADNAHAVHPNYSDRHDGNHAPRLNGGPVIKTNANQRYATNSETSATFRALCAAEKVPVQDFATRADLRCGSTIGPIAATELGVRTLDVGIPQWGMHSCREMCGDRDAYDLYKVLRRFNS